MAEIIKRPKLELADNGFILSYDIYEEKEPTSTDTYSGDSYIREANQVFTFDQQDEALKAFVACGRKAGMIKGSPTEEETE